MGITRFTLGDKREDGASGAATPGLPVEERSGGFLRPSASGGRRRGVVLREILRDLEPRRPPADEDVALRAGTPGVVERPPWHPRDVPVAVRARPPRAPAA